MISYYYMNEWATKHIQTNAHLCSFFNKYIYIYIQKNIELEIEKKLAIIIKYRIFTSYTFNPMLTTKNIEYNNNKS